MEKNRVSIPQVETLLQQKKLSSYFDLISRAIVTNLIRDELNQIREQKLFDLSFDKIVQRCETRCAQVYKMRVHQVINCTGVVVHTNLGRSPISKTTWQAATNLNTHYSSLEFNLESGKRGQRNSLVEHLLTTLTDSEAALVVNNNAAAIYLILSTFAKRKEVIVSRGELVQIGGGFRIPSILKESRAKLVEVGTTNITTRDDYSKALNEKSAAILKVHRSNFALRGFTDEVSTKELSELLDEEQLLIVDQGSGVIEADLPGEQKVKEHIKMGAHLVSFSCDKALGSVQAGAIVGSKKLIDKLIKSPLYRVLRPGKTVLTLLEEDLIKHLNKVDPPVLSLIKKEKEKVKEETQKLIAFLNSEKFSLVESKITLGGGTTPDESLDSYAVQINSTKSANSVIKILRNQEVPIIGFIEKGKVHLNLATLLEGELELLISSLEKIKELL